MTVKPPTAESRWRLGSSKQQARKRLPLVGAGLAVLLLVVQAAVPAVQPPVLLVPSHVVSLTLCSLLWIFQCLRLQRIIADH